MPFVAAKLGDYQGFRRNRSTIDQIFSVIRISENIRVFGRTVWILFVDFEATKDSVNRKALYIAMVDLGIIDKLIKQTRFTMETE